VFFESLGVRYTGPIDGHDIAGLEVALRNAAAYDGPIVVHVLTQKGRGYTPAEDDDEKCLHDAPQFDPVTGPPKWAPAGYTEAFAEAMLDMGERHPQVHAITAAMPGPTGLIPFAERFPDRFHDVGIAEQHAVTSAAGMAMAGLRPVVAVYSTFFTRAFDQAVYDVGLHGLPVIFALDRAGITGDDGPSHHGVLDMSLCLKIPGMTVFAPSSAQELAVMLRDALELDGPAAIRYPKGAARHVDEADTGSGLAARQVRRGESGVCVLAVGKLVEEAEKAAVELDATIWDVRVVKPLDPAMLDDAAAHNVVVTVEDGVRVGGAGAFMADALRSRGSAAKVLTLGLPDEFIPQAKPSALLSRFGLDAAGIVAAVRQSRADSTV
ncbi:MAG: 1-deoxy-D-xylulose-5-phosphate synthase, partial [Acidimicrobiaceae bacterium]|jgi:1-deoxy-D-xylulose-5-phosphate synthase|nr:1-deoxy-D-xylulose-5-phosphate synthase [Acidimicrobiaceae bacterium]